MAERAPDVRLRASGKEEAVWRGADWQPKPAPAEGKVLGVIQWFTVVADLPKAEQFYHETMGLESPGGDPRMRLEYYAVVPFLIEIKRP